MCGGRRAAQRHSQKRVSCASRSQDVAEAMIVALRAAAAAGGQHVRSAISIWPVAPTS